MKRILFVVTYLDCGGISRSLQNFLNLYDTSEYEVDVFAMVHQGMFCNLFHNCKLLEKNNWIEASIAHFGKQQGKGKIESLIAKTLNRATQYRFQYWLFNKVSNNLIQWKKYDAVIGFSEGVPTAFVSYMNHPNKIAWIHCDYANYLILNPSATEKESALYQKFKTVVCVSEFTRQSFINIYPQMESQTKAIKNIMDIAMMKQLSLQQDDVRFNDNIFNIVSVGRIDPVKRFSSIPQVVGEIITKGKYVCWYIIGPKGGSSKEYELLISNIERYKVQNNVILLGERKNPYCFIKAADLLVCTSISEACPYVINEAKVLGTPIVTTDYGSAHEFVNEGIEGFCVPLESVSETITQILENRKIHSAFKENLASFEYNNNEILTQIYSLI